MRYLIRSCCLAVITTVAAMPAMADQAGSLFQKGQDAEGRQNYEAAYSFFKQAYELKPGDMQYHVAWQRTKFMAAAAHVHRGQILRDDGKLPEALAEFEAAKNIDPSDPIADQEIRRTKELIDRLSNKPARPPRPQDDQAGTEDIAEVVELAPIANVPISLKLSEDSKIVYETIAKLAGINVMFDPDYTSRRMRIDLNNVGLEEALRITATASKTFWIPMTSNTIFVAADTKNKRGELEHQVLRTFYLSNWSTPTDIQDATNTLRTLLELPRVQQLQSSGAIAVRGTPAQVALAGKLLNDIDKAKPEVVVEIAVLEVTRDKLRQLGIQPPFTSTSSPSIALQTTNASSITSSSSSSTTTTTTTGEATLNDLANLTARNFVVTIPTMTAQALVSDSKSKIIQQPQLRAVDGQKSTLKIGSRVPVATGSFTSTTVSSLVNTQFSYIDVGVNVDMTPHIHPDREISMKVMFEISSVLSYTTIGTISEPVIGQRHIEHELRLKDGEVNLIGGFLQDSETHSMTGLPLLSQIPILKYFFGQTQKERIQDEIVFIVMPHIVRSQDVRPNNTRAVDIGTANAIEIRRKTQPATAGKTEVLPSSGGKKSTD